MRPKERGAPKERAACLVLPGCLLRLFSPLGPAAAHETFIPHAALRGLMVLTAWPLTLAELAVQLHRRLVWVVVAEMLSRFGLGLPSSSVRSELHKCKSKTVLNGLHLCAPQQMQREVELGPRSSTESSEQRRAERCAPPQMRREVELGPRCSTESSEQRAVQLTCAELQIVPPEKNIVLLRTKI